LSQRGPALNWWGSSSFGIEMSAKQPRRPDADHVQELLDEALDESFPASDPPALVEPGGGISGTENNARTSSQRTKQKPSEGLPSKRRES
jgi:hypothetical protein